ncbi:MAG TPA: flagellar hook-length control protein FliK [Steroidobacteraceae bacterium]
MRIDIVNPRGSPSALSSGSPASLLAEWRVGAVLEAVAIRDPGTGQLFLDIAGQRHLARLASGNDQEGPASGERMQLRVLRNSPVLALERIVEPVEERIDPKMVADALRRLVPRQTSPAPLLANLSWVARGAAGASSLPQNVAAAAAKLWQALPDVDELSDPLKLERARGRSGTFLEAALANDDRTPASRTAIATDLKTLLLQFARTLREHGARPNAAAFADATPHAPLPASGGPLATLSAAPATLALLEGAQQQMDELARQTDGTLARITTTQVTNSAQEGPLQSILIEVPVRYEDRASMLRLRIERDGARRQQTSQETWIVEAALDLGNSGALHARISLTGLRVSVQLRADAPAVVDMLNARVGELETLLHEAGLEVDRIVCRHGLPAADVGNRFSRLLDVRA